MFQTQATLCMDFRQMQAQV